MGLLDNIVDKGKSVISDYDRILKKQKEENSVIIEVISAPKKSGISQNSKCKLWQQKDGYVYFNNNDSILYELINYSWEGPKYKNQSISHTNSDKNEKTKRKGRLTGAALGTIILPGAGTIIGAAIGTGNKTKKGKEESHTISNETQIEIDSNASILLKKKDSNDQISLLIKCNSVINNELLAFSPTSSFENKNNDDSIISNENFEKLKKLKELLDMDIISQEEFDQKKKDILNI